MKKNPRMSIRHDLEAVQEAINVWRQWDTLELHRKQAALGRIAASHHALTEDLLERYVTLVNSGDCGFWDPEAEEGVKAARAALAAART